MARRRTFLEEHPLGIEPPREVSGGVEVSLPATSEGWHQVADWVGVELAENMVYLVTKVEWRADENGEWDPNPRGHVRAEGRLYVSEDGWREFGVRLASGEDPLSMFEGAWQLVWREGFEFADPGVDDVTADLRVAMVGSFELPSENVRMRLPPFLLERLGGLGLVRRAVADLASLTYEDAMVHREYYRAFLEMGPFSGEQKYEVLRILRAVFSTRPRAPDVGSEVLWGVIRREISQGMVYVDDLYRLRNAENQGEAEGKQGRGRDQCSWRSGYLTEMDGRGKDGAPRTARVTKLEKRHYGHRRVQWILEKKQERDNEEIPKAEKMAIEAELAVVQRKNYATYNDFLRAFTLVALRIPRVTDLIMSKYFLRQFSEFDKDKILSAYQQTSKFEYTRDVDFSTVTDLAEKTVVTETLALLKEGEVIDLTGKTGDKVKKGIESLHERVHGVDNKIERTENALLVMQAQVSRSALPPQEAVVPATVANRGFGRRDPANEQCKYCTMIGHFVRACPRLNHDIERQRCSRSLKGEILGPRRERVNWNSPGGMRRTVILLNNLEIAAVEAEPIAEIVWDQPRGRGPQANFILEGNSKDRASPRLLKGLRQLLTRKRVEVEEGPELQEQDMEEAEAPQGVSNLQSIPGGLGDLEKAFADIRLSLPDREGGEVMRAPPGTKLSFHALPVGKLKVQNGTHHTYTLVNGGAEITLIRRDFAIVTGCTVNKEVAGSIRGAGGEIPFTGYVTKCAVRAGNRESIWSFQWMTVMEEMDHDVILGRPWCANVEMIGMHLHDDTYMAYLFGRRLILRIDPTNVVGALKNYKPIDPTIGRWIGFIWQFDYKVERIAGLRNRADGLSRACITPKGVEDAEPIDAFLEYEGGTLVVDNEMADPAITTGQLLVQTLEKGTPAVVAELGEGPVTTVRRKVEKDSWGAKVGAREELMAMTVEGGRNAVMMLAETWAQKECQYLVNLTREEQGTDQNEHKFFLIQMYKDVFKEIGVLLVGNKQRTKVSPKAREEVKKYVLRNGYLFKKEEGMMPRRVVCGRSRQLNIIQAMHDGLAGGHRSSKGTLAKIVPLYFWPGMASMVATYCQTCLICQERSSVRVYEPLRPTRVLGPGHLVHLDLVVMPVLTDGFRYILDTRDNLSGYVEAVALKKKTGKAVADWVEDFYLRHPFVRKFIADNGT
ncbi:hypothetical protein CBR_g4260 [Chara braunii]|uniref:Integrase catalytic domain-containing protein n=1 Tax=Chara braunii TaxID=69332 RepID=A0A388JR78_CHABU|nr:hypothetical protein CBR_g4260 [Chara braunii]|eukprot:GBG60305.1 hypothetical protein CBR_g4260 [Chara braunii]